MRVLCINGDFSNAANRPSGKFIIEVPKEREVYTVREIKEKRGIIGYLLVEIYGGTLLNGDEISFDSSRFIRLEEINTLEESIKKECLINFQ